MPWKFFNRAKSNRHDDERMTTQAVGGVALPVQDTRAAIEELSQVVKNDPEAVEIYLALGSLYRSQGEIERAIQIRNSLILRPGLEREFKARAFFELGRDFRRGGFLDRAEKAFQQARNNGYDPTSIHLEIANLSAERGNFERAADGYGELDLPLAQAHYLVRAAKEMLEEGDVPHGKRFLRHAVRAYPGAIEAWQEKLLLAYGAEDYSDLSELLNDSFEKVRPNLRFVLLEALYLACCSKNAVDTSPDHEESVSEIVLKIIQNHEPEVLLCYYAALFKMKVRDFGQARSWLEKALVLSPDFWLARLELFELSRNDQTLTPFFKEQLNFFIERARSVRRFYCRQCGLKRDQVFFNCPRCRSWHSIAFRTDFSQ